MSDVWEIVALTGHRPKHLNLEQRAWVQDNLVRCAAWLRDNRGTRIAISGFALGSDLWWADAATRAGLELWAYIPFPQQPTGRDWSTVDRAEWQRLRAAANPDRERIFADRYSIRALHARNDGMLADAQALVAVWHSGTYRGGTYSAVVKAARRGMPGIHIDPAGPGVRFELPQLPDLLIGATGTQ